MAKSSNHNNQHHKSKHKTREQILAEMNTIARETRMAERTAETAGQVLCLYTTMKAFGFGQKRLTDLASETAKVVSGVWYEGADFNVIRQAVNDGIGRDYGDLTEYTEDMLTGRKGSYNRAVDKMLLDPQNRINRTAVQYQICFMYCLVKSGYGKQRMERWTDKLAEVIEIYQVDKCAIQKWIAELNNAGIGFESPKDPLTGSTFSIMTGVC